jgi:hypothetical protein
MEQAIHTLKQQAWLHKFLGYDFTIEYKPGKENLAADALSRSFFMAFLLPQWDLLAQIRDAIAYDPKLLQILKLCSQGNPPSPHYSVHNQLLLWKQRLVIPSQHAIIQQILQEFHSSPIGGHSGYTRTMACIAAQYYWHGM